MSRVPFQSLRALAPLLLGLALAACSPSPVAVCQKGCTKTVECIGGTQGNILDCQNACAKNGGDATVQGCSNENDILNCRSGCYDIVNCNDATACLVGCPKCVK